MPRWGRKRVDHSRHMAAVPRHHRFRVERGGTRPSEPSASERHEDAPVPGRGALLTPLSRGWPCIAGLKRTPRGSHGDTIGGSLPGPAPAPPAMPYQFLADAVLALHVAIVAFVVGGLVAVLAGNWRGWGWVNRFGFRLSHLAAIAIVVGESWVGAVCPLTTLEMWLRVQARAGTYRGSFIEHWLQRLLYYEAPQWVFVAAYTVFGVAVLATWWLFPPRRAGEGQQEAVP